MKTVNTGKPLVSVFMISYNHEKYIATAIESALMQQCGFDFEIVIGEDCSTDGTAKIVRSYHERFPGKIRTLVNENNIGMARNFVQTLHACRGKYIAFLEGDDYWTDPLKLQKQFDYLEQHRDFSGVCHNLRRLRNDTVEEGPLYNDSMKPPGVITIDHLFEKNWICTPTVMMREDILKSAPGMIYQERVVDYFVWACAATHGAIGYIHDVMAVYRLHEGGAWNRLSFKNRILLDTENIIRVNELFCQDRGKKRRNIGKLMLRLVWNLKANGFRRAAFLSALKLACQSLLTGDIRTARIAVASI